MAEKKKKFIDDSKMDDIIKKGWADYQKAQKAQTKDKKTTSGTPKKKVKRK
jgi:hypothetical protein